MKGRPRPISLKTDVIKSRNRSKGKSSSKDRSAATLGASTTAPKVKGGRGESTSRSREEGKVGKKSAPGGSEMEEDELEGDDAAVRKARKTMGPYGMPPMPGYGGGPPGAYPYPYPYPHPHHPHQHQPYPPQRARSRSSSNSRRAQSLDSRASYSPGQVRGVSGESQRGPTPGSPGAYPYGAPPPPGYHPGSPALHSQPPEGYYPYYSPYGPGYPGGPPPPHTQYYPHGVPGYSPHPSGISHFHSLQPPSLTHAQSDSRSRSPSTAQHPEAEDSPRSSQSPPHSGGAPAPSAYHAPYNPNYPSPSAHPPAHAPHLQPRYSQSPLSSSTTPSSAAVAAAAATGRLASVNEARESEQRRDQFRLAPMNEGINGPGGGDTDAVAGGEGERIHLPPIGSVAGRSPASPGVPALVPRHTSLFVARPAVSSAASSSLRVVAVAPTQSIDSIIEDRVRRTSVSSNSAASVSSSEGVRSPPLNGSVPLPWGTPARWAPEDERRGRPERRFDDASDDKGKGREFNEVDELENERGDQMGESRGDRRMVGVETGLGELRVVDGDYQRSQGSASLERIGTGSSRSRSSGMGGDERGRSRGSLNSRTQSTSRPRGRGAGLEGRSTSTSTTGRPSSTNADAEVARLRTKVAELTFLNSLMQSRLGQLEGPGRVPLAPIGGLSDELEVDEDDAMEEEEPVTDSAREDEELERYGVTVQDPAMRASMLAFVRSQAGAGVASVGL